MEALEVAGQLDVPPDLLEMGRRVLGLVPLAEAEELGVPDVRVLGVRLAVAGEALPI